MLLKGFLKFKQSQAPFKETQKDKHPVFDGLVSSTSKV